MAERADKKSDSKADEVRALTAEKDKRNAEAMERQNKGKPTPTQEEQDRVALGETIDKLEPDGSDEQEQGGLTAQKSTQPKPGAPYQTRAATPAPKS